MAIIYTNNIFGKSLWTFVRLQQNNSRNDFSIRFNSINNAKLRNARSISLALFLFLFARYPTKIT